MKVILLERIRKLGQIGDEVEVKNGYARNFLLRREKALRANARTRAAFAARRVEIEARNLDLIREAEAVAETINEKEFVIIRQAAETDQLYGSVSNRDVVNALDEAGIKVGRSQVEMPSPIKVLGFHQVDLHLHPDVTASARLNVARSEDEAQARREARDAEAARQASEAAQAKAPQSEGGEESEASGSAGKASEGAEAKAPQSEGGKESEASGSAGKASGGAENESDTPAEQAPSA